MKHLFYISIILMITACGGNNTQTTDFGSDDGSVNYADTIAAARAAAAKARQQALGLDSTAIDSIFTDSIQQAIAQKIASKYDGIIDRYSANTELVVDMVESGYSLKDEEVSDQLREALALEKKLNDAKEELSSEQHEKFIGLKNKLHKKIDGRKN